MKKKQNRTVPVNVLLTKEELQVAATLANKFKSSRAAVLRMGLAELAKKESE